MADPFFASQGNLTRALFRNVVNLADIKRFVTAASLPFCIIKPKYIVDPFQLSVAITKAIYNQKEGTMKTENLHNEIVYCLSPSKNVSYSLKMFVSEDGDSEILVIGNEKLFHTIRTAIKGEEIPLEQISDLTSTEAVLDVYDIHSSELIQSTLLNAVISRISSKDYTNS
jgi:EKC/KEOPS complex subunit CGI121/TPRKB